MRRMNRLTLFLVIAMLGISVTPTFAGTEDHVHNVSVTVGTVLSIDSDTTDFTLAFTTNFAAGSISDTGQTAIYRVSANAMPTAALAGVISAKVSTALTGIAIQGNLGAYTNTGTPAANFIATLNPVSANPVTIGTTATALYDKPTTTSRLLTGTVGVHYRALALQALTPGMGGTTVMTVTIKDA